MSVSAGGDFFPFAFIFELDVSTSLFLIVPFGKILSNDVYCSSKKFYLQRSFIDQSSVK